MKIEKTVITEDLKRLKSDFVISRRLFIKTGEKTWEEIAIREGNRILQLESILAASHGLEYLEIPEMVNNGIAGPLADLEIKLGVN